MGEVGREHPQFPTGKPPDPAQPGADSGAGHAPDAQPVQPIDPDLALIADRWACLPLAIKAGILAMVNASQPPASP